MEWTKEEQEQMDREMAEYLEVENKRYEEEARKNARIFKAIKETLGEKYYEDVFECIMESEGYGLFELTRVAGGHKQMEDWGSFDHIYVDQWMNGGIAGDDFAGDVWIPLKENLYLKFRYEM